MKNNTNGRYFFPTVELKGGVCYFRYDRNYQGKCNYTYVNHGETVIDDIDLNRLSLIVRDPRIAYIVEKVYKKMREEGVNGVDTIISGDTPFGIPTNPMGSAKMPFSVYSNKDNDHDVIVYYLDNKKRKIAYVAKSDISKNVSKRSVIYNSLVSIVLVVLNDFLYFFVDSFNEHIVKIVTDNTLQNTLEARCFVFSGHDKSTAKNVLNK